MTIPRISIIVPVYNTKAYLSRCVNSLKEQTYHDIEIILVDDGSTDGTENLCDELAETDERILVLHKDNGGSSSARNFGITHARGEYIGFVDSDDYVEPDMYERLYNGLCESQGEIVQIGRDEIDEKGNRQQDICSPPVEAVTYTAEQFMQELLLHRGDCSFCTKLVHCTLFKQYQFPEGILNEDFYLLVQMLPLAKNIVSLPGRGYHVFYRIGSNSRKADKEDFSRVYADCVANSDFVAEIVQEKYPSLAKVSLRFSVFQRLEYLLHIPISQMSRENVLYQEIKRWIRKSWWKGMTNPYLTKKNKCYQTLFAIAPKTLRILHRRMRGL